jgi:uncharacterized protein YceH (UPF0502 family)
MNEFEPVEPADLAAKPAPKELTKGQRRVLGVLVEKAITTPDQYPLTLKALTAGCNQKSNRDPVTNYNEETVEQYLDELRGLGLVACIHTESGRTERFRHYVRKRYPFTEPQLAVLTELWLRGRQQLGELRTRASRMAPIDTQEQLRAELTGLMEQGYVQANGPLERRGIEVDHGFYPASEGRRLEPRGAEEFVDDEPAETPPQVAARSAPSDDRLMALEASVRGLEVSNRELCSEVAALKEQLTELATVVGDLRRALGN